MPVFTFQGFATGSAVVLSAAQDGASASNSAAAWGQGSVANIAISVDNRGLAAPAPVIFEATNLSGFDVGAPTGGAIRDDTYHDIFYVWDFGDPASATPLFALNMPDAWKNMNIGYGRDVAHVYSTPGTYTARVWAIDRSGNTAEDTVEVVIANPDDFFPGVYTKIYDTGGQDWSTLYPGAMVFTSWASLVAAWLTHKATPNRILLADDQTFTDVVLDGYQLSDRADDYDLWRNAANIRIGRTGEGMNAPTITQDAVVLNSIFENRYNARPIEAVFEGLHFDMDWDSTTETGVPKHAFFFWSNGSHLPNSRYLIHRCSSEGAGVFCRGIETDISAPNPSVDLQLFISECDIHGWQDYALCSFGVDVEGGTNGVWILGTKARDHVDALNGHLDIKDKEPPSNMHSAVRYASINKLRISVFDGFTRHGWTIGDFAETGRVDQGVLRLQTKAFPGQTCYLDRVCCEGAISQEAEGGVHYASNNVFDKVLVVGSASGHEYHVALDFGGSTYRNMYLYRFDVPTYSSGNGVEIFFRGQSSGNNADNLAAPVEIYGCTMISEASDANNPVSRDVVVYEHQHGDPYINQTIENNIRMLTQAAVTDTVDAPLDLSMPLPGFASRHKGYRPNFAPVYGTFASDVAPGGYLAIPYSEITYRMVGEGQSGHTATNQTYWQANIGTKSYFRVQTNNAMSMSTEDGTFSVTFEPGEVRIHNPAGSGVTWATGDWWKLRLDRSSVIPAADATYSTFGRTVPLPRPQARSAAIDAGDAGLAPYDDFLGEVRPGPGGIDHAGNPRPAGGNERGALLEA